ncbi:membrane-bound lytic murein transglycosylase B [Serratia fonticola]|uniref:Membrane-bound lytic murein transglycosylase B n=1 Tax=Serratia fonticola TaxID=47917 RepID=A0A559TAU1_SERFO|nr:lytic murein transglycosylase [Serratia fonticola]TQI80782.1 membrane-bound lytic murein transglycosylase B [Serratia fonticola]TQI97193.1 membrane-bound lytic murein transglycosylase B [Serratia fonticola]TVZ71689.1 membrane-bound lytic murein transglycosylase B [Serratia fonticola]
MKLSTMSMVLTALILGGCARQNVAAPTQQPVATGVQQLAPTAPSSTLAETGRDPAQFPSYVEKLKSQALAQGIAQVTVDKAFANVHFVDRIITADRNQLEKKITLDDYLKRVLPAWKIQRGREMLQQYQPKLARTTARYGVPEQYIVALWGMESGFGKIQGKEDVISALATLAFEGRREAFFTKQLMAALQVIEQGHVDAGNLKGSWAGAMGQCQFMPTSFLTYAADGDGDGKIDIWNNLDDVFASTANYLATEGWKPGVSWGREVKLPAGFKAAALGLKDSQAHRVNDWAAQGVLLPDGSPLPVSTLRSWVITPDDMQGRAFLVYDNFRTLMHWNRSYYFAISVGMMADGIMQ